ncbi:3-deoxy-D-manno-octulosonic-acid transferase domain-containing protein [Melioribacter roseus P3M-2]|uniref:3-deoxy-D-manno-octulosonic acid transferase n=1 Tax=Melioribacter roseus (strain DSM 23840 / JCM 17771 / VKM B-2668 / P3M-2) TaxID=1191523 RepID=I7A4G8_MELRP|nr:glycosyltransferase N-terminal domain-containing protein [Melioribacter roseus]AFN74796.1 3-deoxy-D-manno-octulosonic-acid transferase domain-containing protein [Melioribacter roseus P3M-2]
MKRFWQIVYNIFFYPLSALLKAVSPLVGGKIRMSVQERERLFENLIIAMADIDRSKKMVWFHASSMGEFEQAKPIVEKLKQERDILVLATFFSPSGYRNSVKYPHADIISYMPFDRIKDVKRFLDITQPDLVIFMRYDIWPNTIWQLEKRGIPYLIADATMRPGSNRLLPVIRSFHKYVFDSAAKILTVSENDAINFLKFGLSPEKVAPVGDTRFDRVYIKSMTAREKKIINEDVLKHKKVLVLGSVWETDEEVIFPALIKLMKYAPELIIIVVPHEPDLIHLEKIENDFYKKFPTIRFSLMNDYKDERVIIVDSVGILLTLYSYADAAYVGGSFRQIHNVLEPAVYSIPVVYGPKIETSQEAIQMHKLGGGIIIKNKKEAYKTFRRLFTDDDYRKKAGEIAGEFVKKNTGATDKILKEIYKYI